MKTLRRKIKTLWQDRRGSEVTEMVYSTFSLCCLILAAMLIIGYALQVNSVSYAAKRVARYVEVSGYAQQTELDVLMRELLPNKEDIGAQVRVTAPNWVNASRRTIQLRDPFTVKITAHYNVTLANPGNGNPLTFRIPITVIVNGQSEIYWKT